MAKKPPWRPTKYTPELQAKFDRLVDEWDFEGTYTDPRDGKQKPKTNNFWQLWYVDQLIYKLGLVRDTFYRYCKLHPAFSDTKKRWETKRNFGLTTVVPFFAKNPTMWIWLSKNCLKMSEHPVDDDGDHSLDALIRALEQSRRKRGDQG